MVEVLRAFPCEVMELKPYYLVCGYTYYQRASQDGNLDPEIGIYRDGKDGGCEICTNLGKDWGDRVLTETLIYWTDFLINI